MTRWIITTPDCARPWWPIVAAVLAQTVEVFRHQFGPMLAQSALDFVAVHAVLAVFKSISRVPEAIRGSDQIRPGGLGLVVQIVFHDWIAPLPR